MSSFDCSSEIFTAGSKQEGGRTNLILCSEYVIRILITHSHYKSSIGSPRASSADATERKLLVICLLTYIRPTCIIVKSSQAGSDRIM